MVCDYPFRCSVLICSIFSGLFLNLRCFSQEVVPPIYDPSVAPPAYGIRARAEVVNGDTIPVIDLNTVNVYTLYQFRSHREREQWTRTKFNVKKVYPYAILAAAKLREYDLALSKIQDERLKKAFIKVC